MNTQTTVAERFKELIKILANSNQSEFARMIGYDASNLNPIVRGNAELPSIGILKGIADRFPGINLNWILSGHGGMFLSTTYFDDSEVIGDLIVQEKTVEYGKRPSKDQNQHLVLLNTLSNLLSRVQLLERKVQALERESTPSDDGGGVEG